MARHSAVYPRIVFQNIQRPTSDILTWHKREPKKLKSMVTVYHKTCRQVITDIVKVYAKNRFWEKRRHQKIIRDIQHSQLRIQTLKLQEEGIQHHEKFLVTGEIDDSTKSVPTLWSHSFKWTEAKFATKVIRDFSLFL